MARVKNLISHGILQISAYSRRFARDDLRKEVERLRNDMIKLYAERDEERKQYADQFAELKEQLAVFKTRVEHLERENGQM